MFKLNLGSIANRISGVFDSLTQLGNTQTTNFQTPGFNPMAGRNEALNNVARTLAERTTEPQDKFAQPAKDLIAKHTTKGVLSNTVNSKALGEELAALVPKGAKLADAVYFNLTPNDKADTARAMIDALSDDTLVKMAKTTNGKALLERTTGLLDGKTTNQWDFRALASGDGERKTRIETALGNKPVEQKPVEQTTKTQEVNAGQNNGDFKPITEDQLLKVAPGLKKDAAKLKLYTELLNKTMKDSGIKTPAQQAAFIATCSAETAGFKLMVEGDSEHASSKMTYKGRGIIQLTHKENYLAASQYLKLGSPDTKPPYKLLVDQPELAAKPEHSFRIAGWFWAEREHKLGIPIQKVGDQPRADLQDFRQSSSLINSGKPMGTVNHWGGRLIHYRNTLEALNIQVSPEIAANIEKGIKGHTGKGNLHLRPGVEN